jgi:hypothetical protein
VEFEMSAASRGEAERRRYPRVAPTEGPEPAVARLRPGREALVVNVSRGGACVEAMSPLRPGHSVDIRLLLSDWHWHGEAQVLRCQVSALPREQKVRYRAGLAFVTPVASEDGAASRHLLPPASGSLLPKG